LDLDRISTYGILKEHTLESLREIIMTLVAKGYVLVTADEYPVLKLTSLSTAVLKGQEKVFHKKHLVEMKAVKSKSKVTGKPVIDCDEGLFLQLKALRFSLSQEKELPPFMIFHDASLKEMAAYFPLNKEDFLKINGVGQAKYENYGDLFIQEIQIFADENPIEIRPRTEADSSPRETTTVAKEPRGGSFEKTYESFIQGQPLDEIAAERGLTLSTIISHLMRCDQQGKTVDWSDFVDAEKETQILDAIESVGLDALKPIKLALPDTCSYNDIKIVIHKNSLV